MAPKRDTASQVSRGRGRHQHLDNRPSPTRTVAALIATVKQHRSCSSTCSCATIKDSAAELQAAQQEGTRGDEPFRKMIVVLSGFAAVMLEGQHSCEAQLEALELFDRLVATPVRWAFPLGKFPADTFKSYQDDSRSEEFLKGAKIARAYQSELVPALQQHATAWAGRCATVTRQLRKFKTVLALANSTQEQQYHLKAVEAAANLHTYCAGLKKQAHSLQYVYMWGCSTLLAQPMLHITGAAVPFAPLALLTATHLQLMRLLQQCIDSGMQLPAPFDADPWEWEVVNSSTQTGLWNTMAALAAALPDACGYLQDSSSHVQAQQLQQLMSSPDLIVPLTCAMLCGGLAMKLVLRPELMPAAASAAAAAGGSSVGLAGCSSSSSSSSVGLEPWALAEGVLLVRAQQLQSHTAAEHQLTAVLQYTLRTCLPRWWQQLHCPGDLEAITRSCIAAALGEGGRTSDMCRLGQLNSALQLLLHVLQQPRLLAAVKPHAASALQVLLSAAADAAASSSWQGGEMHFVCKCLDAAQGLVKLLPLWSAAAQDGASQQQQQQHQQPQPPLQQHQQQQQQGVSVGSQQQLCAAAEPSHQQLLGSLLNLLQQLLLITTKPAPDYDYDDCDSSSGGSDSSSSSDGGSRGEATGVLDPLWSEGKLRDAPLHAMARALPLLQQLLDPLLDPQQLAACLQQQQQQDGRQPPLQHQQQQLLEQVAWALQVTEAAVRVLMVAGTTPVRQAWSAQLAEHQAKHGDSAMPASAVESPELQLLQARLQGFVSDVNPLLCMMSCKLARLVQLPGAWEELRSSVQGQQLLQAALSLVLVYKEGSAGKPSLFHVPLMQLVSKDIRAFLAAGAEGSCQFASSQQQQLPLLPHPQLVVCVLALAAKRHKRLHKQLLRLASEGVEGPEGESHLSVVFCALASYFGRLGAALGDAAGAATASSGAGTAAAAAAAAAGVETAAAAAGAGTAAAAAGAGGSITGVGPAADSEDLSSYSSALEELLQALSDLSTTASSHSPHKQQQDKQQQQQQQQQQEGPQQQQLPPAWAMLLQGPALTVLLPALFRAAGKRNAAAAPIVQHLEQRLQHVRDIQARIELQERHQATMAAKLQQMQQPGRSQQRPSQLVKLLRQQEKELVERQAIINDLKQQLVPEPLPQPLLTGLAKALHVVGALLSSLPSRYRCNNFDCTSLSTVSEAFALVRGRSCVCGGCVAGLSASATAAKEVPAARYCSADCQRQHFHIHKWVCGAQQHLGSTTAAAGSSPHTADGCTHGGSSGSSGSSCAGDSSSSGGGGGSSSSSVGLERIVSVVLLAAAARAETKVAEHQWPEDV